MRIKVIFNVEKIPLGYRMMIVSIIKEALRRGNESYYKELYETKKNKMKPFSSSPYLQNFKINKDLITLDNMNITISSPDPKFILYLYNGLIKINTFHYRNYSIERKKIIPLKEKTIRNEKVIFNSLSPILIENERGQPLDPTHPDYSNQINYYANLILTNYHGKGLKKELKFTPGKMQKQVIKENYRDFNKNGKDKKWLFFTGYKGYFQLQGNPSDLQLLYQLGLSKRRGQGFGLLEIEREEV